MDAPHELAQLGQGALRLLAPLGQQRAGRDRVVGVELLLGAADLQRHRDQPRLGAVVQVALDARESEAPTTATQNATIDSGSSADR